MRRVASLVALASALVLVGCVPPSPGPTQPTTTEAASPEPSPGTARDWRPEDSGPRKDAMGTAILDADGVPIGYLVVEFDTADGVRERFGLPWFSLAREDGTFMPRDSTIFIGETLTFVLPKQ